MAKTQKSYKIVRRQPRYSTKLSTFSNGMYLTDQKVPEGYARILVNYDIDDTGNCLRPRYGKSFAQSEGAIDMVKGPLHVTEYLNIYPYQQYTNETKVADMMISFGDATRPSACTLDANLPNWDLPVYINCANVVASGQTDNMGITMPAWLYKIYQDGDSQGATHGPIKLTGFSYATYDTGFVTARGIKGIVDMKEELNTLHSSVYNTGDEQGYIKMTDEITRPIYTVLNNELYFFGGASLLQYNRVNSDQAQSHISGWSTPVLKKLNLTHKINEYTGELEYGYNTITIVPETLNPTRAASLGYNLLSNTPYTFTDTVGTLNLTGIVPYRTTTYTTPAANIKIGDPIVLRCYYQYPSGASDLQYKVELIDTTTEETINILQDWTAFTPGSSNALTYTYIPRVELSVVRFTLRRGTDTATEVTAQYVADTTIAENITDADFKAYNLYTAKGMVSWKGSIGLFGVQGLENTLIFSAPEEPQYFPFPNNQIKFDNVIYAVHNYLDNLLVVTPDGIWLVTPGTSISAATQKKVLTGVNISELEAINLIVIKDQIFFKAADRFYSLKPNAYTADSTNLKNYDNSIAIANLTKNFRKTILDIINEMYLDEWPYMPAQQVEQDLITNEIVSTKDMKFNNVVISDCYAITRNEEIHYIYQCIPTWTEHEDWFSFSPSRMMVHLIYNTITRAWRLYIEGTPSEQHDYVDSVDYTFDEYNYEPRLFKDKSLNTFIEVYPIWCRQNHELASPQSGLCFIYQNESNPNSNVYVSTRASNIMPTIGIDLTFWWPNKQYFDTGDVAIEDQTTKRWRELQFNVINKQEELSIDEVNSRAWYKGYSVNFKTDVLIDGVKVLDHLKYKPYYVDDSWGASNTGTILVVLEPNDIDTRNILPEVTGVTGLSANYLSESADNLGYWRLDLSKFPKCSNNTVRMDLLGRGRNARVKMITVGFGKYELSDFNWIYRIMTGRKGGEK